MLRFVFVVVLASVPASSLSSRLHGLPLTNLHDARLGDLEGICKLFCEEHDYEEFFARAFDSVVHPRIFCGICKKKFSTTTPKTSTSSSTSTTSSPTTTTSPATTSSSSTTTTTTQRPSSSVTPSTGPTTTTTTTTTTTSSTTGP